jgi:predicted nuclease with TOPRIM domain
MLESEEPRTQEVIHSIKYVDEPQQQIYEDNEPKLDGIDLDDKQAIVNYYLAKNNQIDPDQLEIEKKEKELFEEIKKVVKNKSTLAEYLTNLHASIEVMEERIYELELKAEKKEKQSISNIRNTPSGLSAKGIGQLPINLF